MSVLDLLSAVLLVAGCFFCVAGTLGLLRFPDVYTRLHALTKVDNLGLGFIAVGLMFQARSMGVVIEIALVWLLALAASAVGAQLLASGARRHGVEPWRSESER